MLRGDRGASELWCTTVSGWTMARLSAQPAQRRRSRIQKSRSAGRMSGCHRLAKGGELLAEGQVLDHEVASRAQSRAERRQEGYEEAKHRAARIQAPVRIVNGSGRDEVVANYRSLAGGPSRCAIVAIMLGTLALLSVLCAAPTVPSAPIPTQLLVGAGATETPLGEDARRTLGPRLKTLLESCSIDSVNERSVFAKRDAEADWADILRGPHLRARFDPPLLVHRWDRPG